MKTELIDFEGTIGELSFWGGGQETSGEVFVHLISTVGEKVELHVGAVGRKLVEGEEDVVVSSNQFHSRLVIFMNTYGTGITLKVRYRNIGESLPEIVWVDGEIT
jgi:hypothetical protein